MEPRRPPRRRAGGSRVGAVRGAGRPARRGTGGQPVGCHRSSAREGPARRVAGAACGRARSVIDAVVGALRPAPRSSAGAAETV
ncbi:hypothetical protein FHN55_17660 [Streptomyces sp. NP160]|nr:hypothetical protein FHN55_17660 [Streptomyces sp. NP160]